MSAEQRLAELFEAERAAASPSTALAERGWARLVEALAQGATPMSVATGPVVLGGWSIAKTFAVALMGGAVAGGGAGVAAGLAQQASMPDRVAVASPSSPPVSEPPAPIGQAPFPSPSVLASTTAVPRGSARSAAVATTASAPPSPFDVELALIKRAKREIDRGQPHLGRIWLDEHRERFPAGAFASEREALAVLIACETSVAEHRPRLGAAYLRRYPESPFRDRVARACGLVAAPAPGGKANPENGVGRHIGK